MSIVIKPRERDAILQSLRSGVVPRIGLQHIQVGRKDEVLALLTDLERVKQGGASVRFVIGRFGAGKSFFLNLVRMVAMEKRFVVVQADITPERRLHASGGQARGLYAELMRNMAIRPKPEGGALASLVERWISDLEQALRNEGADDGALVGAIEAKLKPLQELVSGYDFARVIGRYLEGYRTHDDDLMACALRWLRAEYTTRTEAHQDLGVRSIIDDRGIYDYLKLMAAFVRMVGYSGLIVSLDEMGVLSHRLNSSQARNSNYEMILRIVNDCLQGSVSGLGFMLGGSDGFLDDKRRGMASYEALASRLAGNTFAGTGLKDLSGPVIRLASLTPEDLFVLLHNIRHVHALGEPAKYSVPDEALTAFMGHCSQTLGAEFFNTPRDAVKAFTDLLSILDGNPGVRWRDLLQDLNLECAVDPDALAPSEDVEDADNDDLVGLRL